MRISDWSSDVCSSDLSPPPNALFTLKRPMIVGLTTGLDRLVQVRRNRLLSLNQAPETAYVDAERVKAELAYARRMFADNGWPVRALTRRPIEATAAAGITPLDARAGAALCPSHRHAAPAPPSSPPPA